MQSRIYSTSKAWNLGTHVVSSSQKCWTGRRCRSASSCRLVRNVWVVQLAGIPFYRIPEVQRPGCHVIQAWPVTNCKTTRRLDIRNKSEFQQYLAAINEIEAVLKPWGKCFLGKKRFPVRKIFFLRISKVHRKNIFSYVFSHRKTFSCRFPKETIFIQKLKLFFLQDATIRGLGEIRTNQWMCTLCIFTEDTCERECALGGKKGVIP